MHKETRRSRRETCVGRTSFERDSECGAVDLPSFMCIYIENALACMHGLEEGFDAGSAYGMLFGAFNVCRELRGT